MGGTVRPAKRDRDVELSARHCEHVRCVVYNLIECNQRETKRHELDYWTQPNHRGSNPHACETILTDRRIYNSMGTESFQQTLADLVSAIILCDFFSH